MAKRRKSHLALVPRRLPQGGNLGGAIFGAFMEVGVEACLQKFSQQLTYKLGLEPTAEEMRAQIGLERARLEMKRLEKAMAMQERKEREAEERLERQRLKGELWRQLTEKQSKVFDLKIEEKALEIEARKARLEELKAGNRKELEVYAHYSEPIQGVLDFRANPEGIVGGTEEQREAFKTWLSSLEAGKVILILGKRGSGKSTLGAKLAEYLFAVHRIPPYFIGMPEGSENLLPKFIRITDEPEQCELGSFILADEAGIQYLATKFLSDKNTIMRKLLMIVRHRKQSLCFIAQVASDVDKGIVRQADSLIFKEPNTFQTENDRPEVRQIASKVLKLFKGMPKEDKLRSAYVYDPGFEGLIQYDLPEFWTEELSFAWRNVDLTGESTKKAKEVESKADKEAKELGKAEVERKVLKLRKEGLGYERIAQALGIPTSRVRRTLGNLK